MVVKRTVGRTKKRAVPTQKRVKATAARRPRRSPTTSEKMATVKVKRKKRPRGMPVRRKFMPRKA